MDKRIIIIGSVAIAIAAVAVLAVLPWSSVLPWGADAAFRDLRESALAAPGVRGYFALAKGAAMDGYKFCPKPPKHGSVIVYDAASPKFFALAGELYTDALTLAKKRIAAHPGSAKAKAELAEAVARSAWWRLRRASPSQYKKIAAEIHEAAHLSPGKAIYWVMLARVTWWERKRPCKVQWAKAVKYLRRATRADPSCAVAYWMLAQMMALGPHYDVLAQKSAYDLKASVREWRLCYANRAHFNHFFFYYSKFLVRDGVWNSMQALGTAPPNSVPPKNWRVRQ